jgi:hypothetical protein
LSDYLFDRSFPGIHCARENIVIGGEVANIIDFIVDFRQKEVNECGYLRFLFDDGRIRIDD